MPNRILMNDFSMFFGTSISSDSHLQFLLLGKYPMRILGCFGYQTVVAKFPEKGWKLCCMKAVD